MGGDDVPHPPGDKPVLLVGGALPVEGGQGAGGGTKQSRAGTLYSTGLPRPWEDLVGIIDNM